MDKMNVDLTPELTHISLCTGYGGIDLGLKRALQKIRTICYVEIEAFAIANLVAKMEAGALGPAPIWSDLKTFPAHLFRDRVDLITGGYPCQPFSAAGKRKGADDPRHLWPHIRRHVQTIRPFRCFFENVEGHISLGLQEVIADLEADSYKATWGVFSAAEVGAPHRRKRVFIMADACGARRQQVARSPHANEAENEGRASIQADIVASDGERRRAGIVAGGKRLERHTGNGDSGGEPKQARSVAQSGLCEKFGSEIWDVEPELGRVAHGIADRVDRLRLLGNGVVPQQAAKAWIVLSEQVNEKDNDRT